MRTRRYVMRQPRALPTGYLEDIDNLYEVFATVLLVSGYAGPLVRLRETAGNTEQDFYPDAVSGRIEPSAVKLWLDAAGASDARVTTWYGQLGLGEYTQTSASNQAYLNINRDVCTVDQRSINGAEYTGASTTKGNYLKDFIRNRQTVSILMVHGGGGNFAPSLIYWSIVGSGTSRLAIQTSSAAGAQGMRVFGRVADADGTTEGPRTSKWNSNGEMGVSITRVDLANGVAARRWRGESVSGAFLTGTWPDTRPTNAGLFTANGNRFGGECMAVVLTTDYLTDAEDALLEKRFTKLIPPHERGVTRWW